LRPGRRYDLRTYDGNVILFPGDRWTSFDVRARASEALASSLPMHVLTREGKQVRAIVEASGAREHSWTLAQGARRVAREDEIRGQGPSDARPIVELSAALGRVIIVAARTELPTRP
jgi:hypothetical protein